MVHMLLFFPAWLCASVGAVLLGSGRTPRIDERLMSWEEAAQKAKSTVAKLSHNEKRDLARGSHFEIWHLGPEQGFYIGNTESVPRLRIPALKMQDAGQGFRPTNTFEAGTTTSWPSLLALASCWDEGLAGQVGSAMGREFAGKGANVMLGPSVNVHRVARNGRNFEYLSGEDPYLGMRLVDDFVRGVQGQGVIACIKHYAFNEQETARMNQDSIIDDRTAWELYYPPFQSAVDAGAGAFMCSYNKVNGTYACENPELLLRDLKTRMGFQGIVMSDWYATHSAFALERGLDMEMPGFERLFGEKVSHFTDVQFALSRINTSALLDAAALRTLKVIYRHGLDGRNACQPPACLERLTDQTSQEHSELARTIATNAVTLLKNDGVLPLDPSKVRRIFVAGVPAFMKPEEKSADYYTGGGSGKVPGKHTITPIEGILKRANKSGVEVVPVAVEFQVPEIHRWVKNTDVIVYVAGATATEGRDRDTLNLDFNASSDIPALARTGVPVIVLTQVPGAVLMPWREDVAAIANLFLAGQETGSAWASVVFGDASPAGKLPINIPATQQDVIEPGNASGVHYSEGLFTSYRSPTLKAAFPFGHGLSYTTFTYGPAQALSGSTPKCSALACVSTTVTNSGNRPGTEVAQAYVEFDASTGEPHKVLKGFQKTRVLQPGETELVYFPLTERDLSIYSTTAGWVQQRRVNVHVGASSEDIRSTITLLA